MLGGVWFGVLGHVVVRRMEICPKVVHINHKGCFGALEKYCIGVKLHFSTSFSW